MRLALERAAGLTFFICVIRPKWTTKNIDFFSFSVTFFSFFSILYMRQAAANRPGHARSKYTVKEGQYNPVSATTEYGKDFLRILFLFLCLFLHYLRGGWCCPFVHRLRKIEQTYKMPVLSLTYCGFHFQFYLAYYI